MENEITNDCLKKCSHYPNCDCFNNWEKPAKEIDRYNAELFCRVMQDVTQPIKKEGGIKDIQKTIDNLKANLDTLPYSLERLFVEKVTGYLRPYYNVNAISAKDFNKVTSELHKAISVVYNNTDFSLLSDEDIIYYTEWWLGFILIEFQRHLELTHIDIRKSIFETEAERANTMIVGYGIRDWYILSKIPLLNFIAFEKSVWKIKLSVNTNKEEFKKRLKKSLVYAFENIRFYNEKIDPLNLVYCKAESETNLPNELKGHPIGRKTIRYTFENYDNEISKWHKVPPYNKFDSQNPKRFSNSDFVEFSVEVYNFLNEVVYDGDADNYLKKTNKKLTEIDSTVSQPALEETQQQKYFKTLIDNETYSKTIEDFKEKAIIESLDTSSAAHYLKFLRKEKERYNDAHFYYQTYGNGKEYDILCKTYREILEFVSNQISEFLPVENLLSKQTAVVQTDKQENDFVLSTINDFLEPFKDKMQQSDYAILITALKTYFDTGTFSKNNKIITVGRVNIKSFGWALNNIYRAFKQDSLPIDYLLFAKNNISTFNNVDFAKDDYKKSKLYKYFTTKTQ